MRMRTLRRALRHATQAKYSRSNKRPAQQSMQETESRTSNANRVEAVAVECWPSCTPAAHGIERGISDHALESLTLGMPATDTLQKSSDRRAALRDCRPRRAKCLLRALRLRRLRLAVTHAEKPAAASSNAAGRLFSAGVPGENRTSQGGSDRYTHRRRYEMAGPQGARGAWGVALSNSICSTSRLYAQWFVSGQPSSH